VKILSEEQLREGIKGACARVEQNVEYQTAFPSLARLINLGREASSQPERQRPAEIVATEPSTAELAQLIKELSAKLTDFVDGIRREQEDIKEGLRRVETQLRVASETPTAVEPWSSSLVDILTYSPCVAHRMEYRVYGSPVVHHRTVGPVFGILSLAADEESEEAEALGASWLRPARTR